ncbi:MAG: family 16 glycoside hydrolase, partial [Planctomycetota bacterium]
ALISLPAQAVTVPPLFSDGMVLQRNTEAAIWGNGRAGEEIRLRGSWGAEATATVPPNGRWLLRLSTTGERGPHTLEIAGDTTIVVRDILFGEVWFASGQSNMEMKLPETGPTEDWERAAQRAVDIRVFDVTNRISVHPQRDCAGEWFEASVATAPRISAVAFHHAELLQRELQVPVAVITADWGGTAIEAWMSASSAAAFPHAAKGLRWLQRMRDPNLRAALLGGDADDWWELLDTPDLGDWRELSFDDTAWQVTTVPGAFAGELAGFDGIVYLRRTIELPAAWSRGDALLELGPIDDYDDVWVNGTYLGGEHAANRWNRSRSYTVPDGVLRSGANVVCVRVLDTGGPGGLHGAAGDLVLRRDGSENVALAGEWRQLQGRSVNELPDRTARSKMDANVPTVLFNGMIAPVVPYSIRGVLWYQGESNRGNAAEYESLLTAMIDDWRQRWAAPELSFLFVQIAPYNYPRDRGEAPQLRESQRRVAAHGGVGMAVTLDLGDYGDIHPKRKRDVGRRLARWALHRDYERNDLVPCGPLFRQMTQDEGVLRISFDHVGGGLDLRPSPRNPFWIAGADRRFFLATARVEGDALVVSSPDVSAPVAMRYCWEATPEPALFNREGLPASSFRTDSWEELRPDVDNERQVAAHRGVDAGLEAIFNGRDLTGWRNVNCAPSTWKVRDGMIVCSGIPTGVLRTEQQYENFILELEYRHLQPGGNAGLFVWSDPVTARGQPFTRSVEVQVLDGVEGGWYTSQGDIFPIHGATMVPRNGRGASRAFPTEPRAERSPLWNHYRVVCNDGQISLAVNGKVVTRGDRCAPRKGYICLESEGSEVHFRNLRLRPLPPSQPPLAPAMVATRAQGFECLYNGVDLSGWKSDAETAKHWQARDWVLRFDGAGSDLWSERSFSDFVLICDWRWTDAGKPTGRPVIDARGNTVVLEDGEPQLREVIDAGDSGIYLRGSSKSQVNIWCWPIGSGEVYGYRTDSAVTARVRAGVTPRTVADAAIGSWNRFEITMRGDRLTVVLNGQTVIDNAQLPGIALSGPIALQAHGAPIEFANIYVKELLQF